MPYLETMLLILHIALFFVCLMPLVYLAPQHSAAFVFTEFESRGGWRFNVIAWCVGLLTTTFPFTGYDGACRMSEEIEHAEMLVPRALITSVALNGALGFDFLIALLFSMGDIKSALRSLTVYPLTEIFYYVPGNRSKRATNAIICGVVASALAVVFGLMHQALAQPGFSVETMVCLSSLWWYRSRISLFSNTKHLRQPTSLLDKDLVP